MKKPLLVTVVLVLLIAAAAVWWSMSGGHAQEEGAGQQGAPQAQEVAVKELIDEVITYTQQLPGRISPYRQSQVRPQVNGIITERLFEEGADVEQGQQLYQIDDARYVAALNSAKADLQSANANVKSVKSRAARYEDLVKINAVSKQEYDDIKAELDQANASIAVAQAAVDLAQVNLDYTKVYAPISGRISRSFVTEGTLVTANQEQNLATITQLDPVYVDMQQSGSEALKLRSRMKGHDTISVTLLTDEENKTEYSQTGTLKLSEVTVDETTGSIALRAQFPNPDYILLPGLFVRAKLNLGEGKALLVPQRATTRTAEGNLTVWVVDAEEKAQPRQIKVSQPYQDNWVVSDGVAVGDRVIVEGYQKVAKDASVKAVAWSKEAGTQEKNTNSKAADNGHQE